MKRIQLWLLWTLPLWMACNGGNPTTTHDHESLDSIEPIGKQLMTQYCGACHTVPAPTDLDQKTWKNHILIRMGAYMGIYNDLERYYDSVPEKWLEPGIGGQRVREAGIYPAKPVLSRPDWETLRDYILSNAPMATLGPSGMLSINRDLPGFKARPVQPDPALQPLVTAIAIKQITDTTDLGAYVAFFQQSLLLIDPQGKMQTHFDGLYGPVQIYEDNFPGLTIAEIGSMKGSDNPKGSIRTYLSSINDLKDRGPLYNFDTLMRPVMARWGDLDQDGDRDVAIAEFGYHIGALSWQENEGNNHWERHLLYPDDGTVSIHIVDITGDSLPDILSLKANADERVDLYVNKGHGEFEQKNLLRFNPTYGCTAMEVIDWDQDGRMDFLVANGDNGDYPPILKPNHGIRLYLNKGNANFELAYHWAINGAYGFQVRDFDQDGDLDLAAVSFYPDYKNRPDEAFVYFQNQGYMQFTAHTFPEVNLGRWMVMDAGDIDFDGDQDIILGAFDVKSDDCSEATYDKWIKDNVPVMILENTLRN